MDDVILPKGNGTGRISEAFDVIADPSIPKGEAKLVINGKVVGHIVNIETEKVCPIVEHYVNRHKTLPNFLASRGRAPTVNRPVPQDLPSIKFDPKMSIEDIEKYWVVSAINYTQGNIRAAAKILKIGTATIYKKLARWGFK